VSAKDTEPSGERTVPTEQSEKTAARGKPSGLVLVLGVLVALSAVGVGILLWQFIGDSRAAASKADALDAARTGTAEVLSFDPTGVNAQLAQARKVVSGAFAAQFEQLATAVIVPATQQIGLSTKAEVSRAAVIDATSSEVNVVEFVKQTTSSKQQPQAKSITNQVKVTMTKADDGRWLISTMQPL
jgi:Mce-associated membrane protein